MLRNSEPSSSSVPHTDRLTLLFTTQKIIQGDDIALGQHWSTHSHEEIWKFPRRKHDISLEERTSFSVMYIAPRHFCTTKKKKSLKNVTTI